MILVVPRGYIKLSEWSWYTRYQWQWRRVHSNWRHMYMSLRDSTWGDGTVVDAKANNVYDPNDSY